MCENTVQSQTKNTQSEINNILMNTQEVTYKW